MKLYNSARAARGLCPRGSLIFILLSQRGCFVILMGHGRIFLECSGASNSAPRRAFGFKILGFGPELVPTYEHAIGNFHGGELFGFRL